MRFIARITNTIRRTFKSIIKMKKTFKDMTIPFLMKEGRVKRTLPSTIMILCKTI